jgi:serine/threonine-protein kinase
MTTPRVDDPDATEARVDPDPRLVRRGKERDVQFAPGTVIAGRYRISSILGKGGMGEVYRADDTKLGQTVALKFLPARRERDPAYLGRLHDEVRLGRQITHPNVCRIYDIVEADGAHFVAMEYVDGEDLSRLLQRIGRLPHDKAVDITRGIAAGLNAAHAKGILHRDLKPANVMLDSQGDARIMDFGLALASGEDDGTISGTPAYMAPEQLEGKPATVQSDLYALGLVMYELFTGKRARDSASEITTPSSVIRDIEPVVERLILRCLSRDPAERPRSAREVIAALPGGDPLAAALAAGETPSPGVVAAAGAEGSLKPGIAWAMLGAVAILFALVVFVRRDAAITKYLPLDQSPEVLRHHAAELLRRFGVPATGAPIMRTRRREGVRPEEAAVLRLEYGVGPTEASLQPQFATAPGRATIELDLRGHLTSLLAVPDGPRKPRPLDWALLLAEAGLDPGALRPAPPTHVPPAPFDARAAWIGTRPSIRVEAAAWQGTPVWFRVTGDGERDAPTAGNSAVTIVGLTMTLLAVMMAVRNLRLRRSDRRSAVRVGVIGMAFNVTWLMTTDYDSRFPWLVSDLELFAGRTILEGAAASFFYLALEPFMRRRWPEKLIAWARLMSGRFRDPMVGRDVLIGMIGGLLFVTGAIVLDQGPHVGSFWNLLSVRHAAAGAIHGFEDGFYGGFVFMTLLAVLTMILRRRTLAIVAFFLVILVIRFGVPDLSALPGRAVMTALLTFVAVRYGLLALMAFEATFTMLYWVPALTGVSWAAPLIAIPFGVLAALALWAFRTSLGSTSPFGALVENYDR